MSKRSIIAVVTFLGGLYYFLKFFLPRKLGGEFLDAQLTDVSRFFIIIGGVALGIGVINVCRVYGRKVVRKEREWLESIALLVAFFVTLVIGLINIIAGDESGLAYELYWNVIYAGIFMALGAAMFSLLGFYIAQAAFRTFRVRSVEAALIMSSALLIMLGALPMPVLSDVLPEWFGAARTWLLSGINVGVQRAVLLGSGAAWLIMAVRMWFSLDRSNISSGAGGSL